MWKKVLTFNFIFYKFIERFDQNKGINFGNRKLKKEVTN